MPFIWTCLLVLAAGSLAFGLDSSNRETRGDNVGARIPNLTFTDAAGKPIPLSYLKGSKALVVVFLNFDCPNSTGSAPALAELARTYRARGIGFVGLYPGDDETAQAIARQAASFKLGFLVYRDDRGAAVRALKARVTPEAFVLDPDLVLRYRGRIDDSYTARLKKNRQVTRHELRDALDDVLAGKPVRTPVTRAVGCPVALPQEARKDGKVTYYRDVLPILQNNCQTCHRPGEVGPFSLMTYKQAVKWASDIKEYTQNRQMPPWKIAEGVPFHNERRLSEREIATLASWADHATPEGDSRDAPRPKTFPSGWTLGKPDLILQPKEDFVLGPTGRDLFRCFALPTSLTGDQYVVAIDVRPSNPRVVHHTLNFVDTQGQGRKLEARARERNDQQKGEFDQGPGYTMAMGVGFRPQAGLGGWAPGQVAHLMPEGYGWQLPRGSDVVIQVHYHRNGRVERDRTQIGLYFAKKKEGMKRFKGGTIAGRFFAIPAGKEHFTVKGSLDVAEDCELHTIMPHMHLIGRQIKVTLTRSGRAKPQTLLAITDWDYNWQETYLLKKPLKLKSGDRLEVEAVYDNSRNNPNNPHDPPRLVTFGEQTTNEMCFVFLGATSDGPGRSPFARRNNRLRVQGQEPRKKTQPDQGQKR
jgi:peroxiredoxin